MLCRLRWVRCRQGRAAATPPAATCTCLTPSALGPPAATGPGSTSPATQATIPRGCFSTTTATTTAQAPAPSRSSTSPCASPQCTSSITAAARRGLVARLRQWQHILYRLATFRIPDIGEPYLLSTRNELVVLSGWDVRATLYGEYSSNISIGDDDSVIISRADCSPVGDNGSPVPTPSSHRGYCTGHDGCCHAPIPAGRTPKEVRFEVLNRNHGNRAWA